MAERLPIVEELGDALEEAFAVAETGERRPRRGGARSTAGPATSGRQSRRRWRAVFVTAMLPLLLATTAAAGTVAVLRGTIIAAPDSRDAGPAQTPAANSSLLAAADAADPDGRTHWALRVARSRTGLVCGTIAQRAGRRFALTGLDGRLRLVPERLVDSCTAPRTGQATLVGARVFDARRPSAVRTVVYGLAPGARGARVQVRGRNRAVAVARDGSFLLALRGLPEDLALSVTVALADGREEAHPFGVSRFVVADPDGGRAWRVEAGGLGVARGAPSNPIVCATFRPAREAPRPTISPAACGSFEDPRRRRGFFFAVRRIVPGTGRVPVDIFGEGNWGDHPARTAVWGQVGDDIEAVTVTGPGGLISEATIAPSRSFLAIFGPDVDPRALSVRIRFTDGRVETRRGSQNLADGPVPKAGP